jgi:hypothetical protein
LPADVSWALALDDEEQQEPDEAFEADADDALSWSQAMALAAPTDTARAATRRVNLRMNFLQARGASEKACFEGFVIRPYTTPSLSIRLSTVGTLVKVPLGELSAP